MPKTNFAASSPDELLNELYFVEVPGKNPSRAFQGYYTRIYEFWHAHWLRTFGEVNGITRLHSDEFCRQSEVSALFLERDPVAVFLYDWFDLRNAAHLEHSYFSRFPDIVLETLRQMEIAEVMIINYLAVAENWRRTQNHVSLADVMMGLAVKRFVNSRFRYIVAYARNSRRTNDLMYNFGAVPVHQNLVAHREPSDFVLFDRHRLNFRVEPAVTDLIERLWSARMSDHGKLGVFESQKSQMSNDTQGVREHGDNESERDI